MTRSAIKMVPVAQHCSRICANVEKLSKHRGPRRASPRGETFESRQEASFTLTISTTGDQLEFT